MQVHALTYCFLLSEIHSMDHIIKLDLLEEKCKYLLFKGHTVRKYSSKATGFRVFRSNPRVYNYRFFTFTQ